MINIHIITCFVPNLSFFCTWGNYYKTHVQRSENTQRERETKRVAIVCHNEIMLAAKPLFHSKYIHSYLTLISLFAVFLKWRNSFPHSLTPPQIHYTKLYHKSIKKLMACHIPANVRCFIFKSELSLLVLWMSEDEGHIKVPFLKCLLWSNPCEIN